MRMSIIIATCCVGLSFAYRYFVRTEIPKPKTVFSWTFILIMLAILSQTVLTTLADTIAYIIILIIVLNDGYDFASSL